MVNVVETSPTEVFDLAMDKGLSAVHDALMDPHAVGGESSRAITSAAEELARLCKSGSFDSIGGASYLKQEFSASVGRIEDAERADRGESHDLDYQRAFILNEALGMLKQEG